MGNSVIYEAAIAVHLVGVPESSESQLALMISTVAILLPFTKMLKPGLHHFGFPPNCNYQADA